MIKRSQLRGGIDSDYTWLMTHVPGTSTMQSRQRLVGKIVVELRGRIEEGRLPYTLGVFGGWGTGKTTLLAMLAKEFETAPSCKVVYFNSWKYAGFMEIVPALIYKILQYGVEGTAGEREEAARRVILALGKKYSDQIGDWAKTKIGVNPVELFKDIYDFKGTVQNSTPAVEPGVVHAYYTQVDKAQDELRNALGTVSPGRPPERVAIVLVDELDRCDPDEAFNVIKQLRVLFGMRDLPIAFVIGANPEPIGLAIKHRYGLESESGDYEARRILEKFVDSYEDLSTSEALGGTVQTMWENENLPWIMKFDTANVNPQFNLRIVHNATALDALTTSVPLLANIRLLYKSFEYVKNHNEVNKHFLWTKWFLEIAKQIDPHFRADIRKLAQPLETICRASYQSLHTVRYRVGKNGGLAQITFETDKGGSLFAIYRSFFWEHASKELERLGGSNDPEDIGRFRALGALLSEPLKVDAVVLLTLLPFRNIPSFDVLSREINGVLPDFRKELEALMPQLGNELSRRAL